MVKPRPNLFIVGAAKAGTSTLHRSLAEHPGIYMSEAKEPNYFGADLTFRCPRISRSDYLRFFERGKGARYRGEASVLYLYSRSAPDEIRRFAPDARIVIMLRDPVDLVYSGFWENRKTGVETEKHFERALSLESARRAGRGIPRYVRVLDGLFYSELARAPEAARRYEAVFGREAVFVGDFEDLRRDRDGLLRRLYRFLDLPPVGGRNTVENRGARPRSVLLSRWVQGNDPAVAGIGRAFIPRKARRPVASALRALESRLNRRPGYPPMCPETRRRLETEYAAYRAAYRAICAEHRNRWSAADESRGLHRAPFEAGRGSPAGR